MKNLFLTLFLMGTGAVLFVAALVVVAALFFTGRVKEGRFGNIRIEVSRDGVHGDLSPEDAEVVSRFRNVKKSIGRVDGSIKDVSREFDKFFDRFDRRFREAEKDMRRARVRLSAFSGPKEDLKVRDALRSANLALAKREELLGSLKAFRKKTAGQAEALQRSRSKLTPYQPLPLALAKTSPGKAGSAAAADTPPPPIKADETDKTDETPVAPETPRQKTEELLGSKVPAEDF